MCDHPGSPSARPLLGPFSKNFPPLSTLLLTDFPSTDPPPCSLPVNSHFSFLCLKSSPVSLPNYKNHGCISSYFMSKVTLTSIMSDYFFNIPGSQHRLSSLVTRQAWFSDTICTSGSVSGHILLFHKMRDHFTTQLEN